MFGSDVEVSLTDIFVPEVQTLDSCYFDSVSTGDGTLPRTLSADHIGVSFRNVANFPHRERIGFVII